MEMSSLAYKICELVFITFIVCLFYTYGAAAIAILGIMFFVVIWLKDFWDWITDGPSRRRKEQQKQKKNERKKKNRTEYNRRRREKRANVRRQKREEDTQKAAEKAQQEAEENRTKATQAAASLFGP
tara:strand:+ start:30 stop:410 length:381 start_codon:yes stop_codon:yes gene_type:complete